MYHGTFNLDLQDISFSTERAEKYQSLTEEVEAQAKRLSGFVFGNSSGGPENQASVDGGQRDEEPVINLPLVDSNAQGALRRRIVHDRLDRL